MIPCQLIGKVIKQKAYISTILSLECFFSFITGDGSSILCEFSLTVIRSHLEAKRFWSLNKQESPSYENSDCNENFDYETDEEMYNEFLSENTILDETVSGECKLILPYNVTSFDAVVEANKSVAYLATSSSKRFFTAIFSTFFHITFK